MDIWIYKNPIYQKIALPDELLQNGNLCVLIEEVKLDESEEDNYNTLINTLRNITNVKNHGNILTLVRSSYSRDIATIPNPIIKQHQNIYKTLKRKDMIHIVSKLSSKSQRNKKFGLFVSDMFLQLLNVAEGETSTDIICDLDGNLESTFPRMIERYKN